jgi:hypothetical protein
MGEDIDRLARLSCAAICDDSSPWTPIMRLISTSSSADLGGERKAAAARSGRSGSSKLRMFDQAPSAG